MRNKKGFTLVCIIGFISICLVSFTLFADYPNTYDNNKFIVFDGNIFRIDAIDYSYKSYDKHAVSIASGDGNLFHINVNRVIMSYKTREERDEKFSILLRQLKLRDSLEPQ